MALQLTNILRDVGADAARGRLYLPLEDLRALRRRGGASCSRASGGAARRRGCAPLLRFQAERAREHYARAAALLPAGGPARDGSRRR